MSSLDYEKLEEKGIEELSFNIYSNKQIHFISEDFKEWKKYAEYDTKYVRDVYMDIMAIKDFEDEEEKKIGNMIAYFFEPEVLIKETTFWNVCDSISGDLEAMASQIIDKNMQVREEICPEYNSILYIDELFLEKEYRNIGIGKYILDNLRDFLYHSGNLTVGTIITYIYPMEGSVNDYKKIEDEMVEQEKTEKMMRFLKKCGFKQLENEKYWYQPKKEWK